MNLPSTNYVHTLQKCWKCKKNDEGPALFSGVLTDPVGTLNIQLVGLCPKCQKHLVEILDRKVEDFYYGRHL